MRKFTIFLLLLFSIQLTYSQYFSTGQDPSSIHWKQIKTENFRLVFPDYAEKSAIDIAKYLSWAYEYVGNDMHHATKKLDIIMHMEASTSNAMVAWAPSRMEIYNTPPQDNYAQDWYQQLAIHEFRHAVQMDKLNQGFTRILYYIFGEQATAAVVGLFIPSWLLEGDAVMSETQFSHAGRGRMASFSADLEAQLCEKKIYSYNKAVFGSYKDYVPNQYVLGYNMVSLGRNWYGNNFWSNNIDYIAHNPFKPGAFNRSIKIRTKLNKTKFYKKCLTELKTNWQNQNASSPISLVDTLKHKKRRGFTNYNFPHYINDTTLFCLKSGMDDKTRFVSIDLKTGKENTIFIPGYGYFDGVHFVNNIIIWTEFRFDPRWEHKKYVVLMKYDIQKKKATELTHKTRYFAPDLNSDATKVVCVEVTEKDQYNLVIVSTLDGKTIKSYPMNDFIMTPSWCENEEFVVATRLIKNKGLELIQIDVKDGSIKVLNNTSYTYISSPLAYKNYILFIGELNGTSNIFLLNPETSEQFQITNMPYKVSDATITPKGSLLFSNYSSNGYDPVEMNIEIPTNVNSIKNNFIWTLPLETINSHPKIENDTASQYTFTITKYSKFTHLLNIHSWSPFAINVSNSNNFPGVNISSQNLQNTMIVTAGYGYLDSMKLNTFYANVQYLGWYPVLDFNFSKSIHSDFIVPSHASGENLFNYIGNKMSASISLPLKFNKGKTTYYLSTSITGSYNMYNKIFPDSILLNEKNIGTLDFKLRLARFSKTAAKDLSPRNGISLDIEYRQATQKSWNDLSYSLKIYTPGIGKHHSMRFSYQNLPIYPHYPIAGNLYGSYVYPRGINYFQIDELSSISADYYLTLLYPDLSIGRALYIKRIKANVYSDLIIRDNFNGASILGFTKGVDITFDAHIFRFVAPIEMGLRVISFSFTNKIYAQFLFSVGFDEL